MKPHLRKSRKRSPLRREKGRKPSVWIMYLFTNKMVPYREWIRDEQLTLTETLGGYKTDYKYILAYYRKLIQKYDLKLLGIGYDPHNASAFLADLDEFGCDLTVVVQSAKSLNDPTDDFRNSVDAGKSCTAKRRPC